MNRIIIGSNVLDFLISRSISIYVMKFIFGVLNYFVELSY